MKRLISQSGEFAFGLLCLDETPDPHVHFIVTFRDRAYEVFGSDTGAVAFRYAYSSFRRLIRNGIPAAEMRYFA